MPQMPTRYGPGRTTSLGWNVSVSTGASAHTKGGWTQIIASTAADYSALLVTVNSQRNNGSQISCLLDIGIGAGGSELVVWPDILCNFGPGSISMMLPIEIPAGSRIAVRGQPATASAISPLISILGIEAHQWADAPGGKIHAIGANTGTTNGVVLDAGGSANNFPAAPYTQLTASSPADLAAILPIFGTNLNSAPVDANFQCEIAVGASSSEVVVATVNFNTELIATSPGSLCGQTPFWLPAGIPAGSRLSARIRSSTNDATDRQMAIVLYGLEI